MIELPASTIVNKMVPKNAFYKHIDVSSRMKNLFVSDIEKIIWANKISPFTLCVSDGRYVHEIAVFDVLLKHKEYSKDLFLFIDKNIPRHTLFILSFNGELSLLLNYKEPDMSSSLFNVVDTFQTSWALPNDLQLRVCGTNMDIIYENIVRYVAGSQIYYSTDDLSCDIQKTKRRNAIMKDISILKSKIQAEPQPHKKFYMHKQLNNLFKMLDN